MPVVVVANPKGGVGKSTLSTNIAGYFARQGHAVMLGDIDRQQSSRLWLGLRPSAARPIAAVCAFPPARRVRHLRHALVRGSAPAKQAPRKITDRFGGHAGGCAHHCGRQTA